MQHFYFLLLLFLLFNACTKENKIKADYSFEKVVDSTFYCTVKIGDVVHKFPYHIKALGHSQSGKDSVIIGYFFRFVDSKKQSLEDFTITISKAFKIKDLANSIKRGNQYIMGNLSNEEFLSIFQQANYSFSTYDPNYFQCMDCELTSGISIVYNAGSLTKTSFTAIYLDQDSISSFYKDSKFSITNLQILDDSHIVIEGNFNVKIFTWGAGKYKRFSEGYFKAYTEKW